MTTTTADAARNDQSEITTRGRLLDTAEQLVTEVGARQLTLETVAAAAGVSRTTAYRQFGSNAELVGAITVRRMEAHRRTVNELSRRENDALSKLEEMFVYALVVIARDPGLDTLVEEDTVIASPQVRALANELLLPLFGEGQADQLIRRDVSTGELAEWVLRTTGDMARQHLDEGEVRRRFRLFITPALQHGEADAVTQMVVAKTKKQLREALELLDQLHRTNESER